MIYKTIYKKIGSVVSEILEFIYKHIHGQFNNVFVAQVASNYWWIKESPKSVWYDYFIWNILDDL